MVQSIENLKEAVRICRGIGGSQGALRLARTLSQLGSAYREIRQYPEAFRAHEEAIDILRRLVAEEGDVGEFLVALGSMLNNYGNALNNVGEAWASIKVLEEAAQVRRRSGDRAGLANTAMNLANSYHDAARLSGRLHDAEELLDKAEIFYQQAADLFLEESEKAPWRLDGIARLVEEILLFQAESGRLDSLAAYMETLNRLLPPNARPEDISWALSNRASVVEQGGDDREALSLSLQAVQAAESYHVDNERAYLQKGYVTSSYRRILRDRCAAGDTGGVYRCLAAMRDSGFGYLASDGRAALDSALQALDAVQQTTQRATYILFAEQLNDDASLVGVCGPGIADGMWYQIVSHEPFWQVFKLISDFCQGLVAASDEPELRRQLGHAAGLAWATLPDYVRGVLDPHGDGDVLISGDTAWTHFPWEVLRFGSGETDWLGLHLPLGRWHGASPRGLRRTVPRRLGGGRKTACGVCAWDAGRHRNNRHLGLLEGARVECRAVERALRGRQYQFVSDGGFLMGGEAKRDALLSHLRVARKTGLSLLHYAGHGGIDRNEEVLVLADGNFGSADLRTIRGSSPPSSAPPLNDALVVLNSCRSGRTRAFGGQREDLAWGFLEAGAAAVISNTFPTEDVTAARFATAFFESGWESGEQLANVLLRARREVERELRARPGWMWWTQIVCHGAAGCRLP